MVTLPERRKEGRKEGRCIVATIKFTLPGWHMHTDSMTLFSGLQKKEKEKGISANNTLRDTRCEKLFFYHDLYSCGAYPVAFNITPLQTKIITRSYTNNFFFPLTYARNPVQNCPHIAVDGKIPRNMPARYHYRSLESHCVLSTILWGKLLHPKLCVEIIHPQTNYCANDKNTAWREELCLCPLQPSCECLEHKETAILTGSIHIRPSPLFYYHISNSVISKNKD